MKILEFAFIGYPGTDVARARAYYEGILGLTCTTDREASANFEHEVGPHTPLISSRPDWKPSSNGPCVALEVENFDEAIAHLKKHEVAFVGEPFESPICRGAFIEGKEVSGGYWMVEANSKEDLVEWALRCPAAGDVIEIRQIWDAADFGDKNQKTVMKSICLSMHLTTRFP